MIVDCFRLLLIRWFIQALPWERTAQRFLLLYIAPVVLLYLQQLHQVVVNGMSPSRRDSRFANSGIVTSLMHGISKEL